MKLGNAVASVKDRNAQVCLVEIERNVNILFENSIEIRNSVRSAGSVPPPTFIEGAGISITVGTISVDNTVVPFGSGATNKSVKWLSANTQGSGSISDDGSTLDLGPAITATNIYGVTTAQAQTTVTSSGGTIIVGDDVVLSAGAGVASSTVGRDLYLLSGSPFGGGAQGTVYISSGGFGGVPLLQVDNSDISFTARNPGGTYRFFNPASPTQYGVLDFNSISTIRTYTYPDASGTLALTTTTASPSASVGLAAVNGSALTFMRSDAAPALSQAIVPTWSGVHTFTARDVHNGGITNVSTAATQFTTGYDASNKISVDTASTGATTLTLAASASNISRLILQPSGGSMTNAASTAIFQVNSIAGLQKLWVGHIASAGAESIATRIGYGPADYMQILSTAADQNFTIATKNTTGSANTKLVVFAAPTTFADVQAAAFTTAAPTSNIGFTFTGVAPTSSIGFVYNTTAPIFNIAPLFNSVNPTFTTTAANTGQYFEWPITSPATMKMRFGVFSQTFNSRLDNAMVQSYNINPTSGVKDATGEHAYALQFEGDFHPSGTAGDDQAEYNWSYTTPGNPGTNWRPFTHELKVAENTITGQAYFTWTPNNLNSGLNRYLELSFPWIAMNRDTSLYSAPTDSSVFSMMALRNFSGAAGFSTFVNKSVLYTDAAVSFAGTTHYVNAAIIDFTPGSKTIGDVIAYSVPTPVVPGTSTTVASLTGTRIQDLTIDGTKIVTGQAFQIDSQTVSNAAQGNLKLVGIGYNHGHIQFGAYHIWDSNSGTPRIKASTPTSDGDGNAILSLATPATGGSATAGALYTGTEQSMLQKAYDVLRTMGALT